MAEMVRKSSEKTSFAVACRLLSQYIKETGSAPDLGLAMAPRPAEPAKDNSEVNWSPATVSLLPGADVPGAGKATEGRDSSLPGDAMELFPQQAGFGLAPAATGKTLEIREQQKGQLTIFYGGKVMVFDDFPSGKVKDLMQLASKGTLTGQNFSYVALPPTAEANNSSKPVPAPAIAPVAAAHSHPPNPTISALPQPPKASLKRFLEERKHRINVRAPYQVIKPLATDSPSKPEESRSWLGLAPQVPAPSHRINSDCSQ